MQNPKDERPKRGPSRDLSGRGNFADPEEAAWSILHEVDEREEADQAAQKKREQQRQDELARLEQGTLPAEALIQALCSEDEKKRQAAVMGICRKPSGPLVDNLTALLQHPDRALRAEAVRLLGIISDERALEPLLRLVREEREGPIPNNSDPGDRVRHILRKYATEVSNVSTDPPPDHDAIRRITGAVRALAKIGGPRVELFFLTANQDDVLRPIILDALPELKAPADKFLAALQILYTHGRAGHLCEEGIARLEGLGDERAVAELLHVALGHAHSIHRRAVEALGRLQNPGIIEPILKALTNWPVAADVVRLLLPFQDPRTVPTLLSKIDGKGGLWAQEVIEILGEVAGREAVGPLLVLANKRVTRTEPWARRYLVLPCGGIARNLERIVRRCVQGLDRLELHGLQELPDFAEEQEFYEFTGELSSSIQSRRKTVSSKQIKEMARAELRRRGTGDPKATRVSPKE